MAMREGLDIHKAIMTSMEEELAKASNEMTNDNYNILVCSSDRS